jgi:hypothetical protein
MNPHWHLAQLAGLTRQQATHLRQVAASLPMLDHSLAPVHPLAAAGQLTNRQALIRWKKLPFWWVLA